MKKIIIISILTVIVFAISITAVSAQSQYDIPSWIKNNAGWWADGSIDDTEFVSGIQYLIKEGIMTIPQTQSGQSINQEIPSWIKNTAEFWAEDKISDREFISALQFLVEKGIVVIPQKDNEHSINTSNKIIESQKQLPTEDEIVSKILSNMNGGIYGYSSLENRSVKYEDGKNTIRYDLYDDSEVVGMMILVETDLGITDVSVTTMYEFDQKSVSRALWLLAETHHKLIPIEKWKEETGSVFMPWVIETVKGGKSQNNITIDGKKVFFSNYDENLSNMFMTFRIEY